MKWLDPFAETCSRQLARRTTRRSFLARLGSMWVATATLPLLPVARGEARAPRDSAEQDPARCSYWRYCAIDGYLCSCCGGSQSTCPPGTQMSAVTWVGTCHNPADGKDYIISYNDCCGKGGCSRCMCKRDEGDLPLYQAFRSNDYNWCTTNDPTNIPYHCSTARIVGIVESPP